jgi:hypothetical protein
MLVLALGCEKSKPEEVAPLVRPPAAAALPSTQGPAAPPAPAPLASCVVVADRAVASQLLSGIGKPETSWAWTLGKSFSVELGVPADAKTRGGRVLLKFAIHDDTLKQGRPLSVSGNAGATSLPAKTYEKAGTSEYTAQIPAKELQTDRVRLEFTLDKTIRAGASELGVMLLSVTLSPS